MFGNKERSRQINTDDNGLLFYLLTILWMDTTSNIHTPSSRRLLKKEVLHTRVIFAGTK
jgi:hypothetical protein